VGKTKKGLRTGAYVGLAGAIVFGGFKLSESFEAVKRCATDPVNCIEAPWKGHTEAKAEAPQYHDFQKIGERAISNIGFMGFGQGQITVKAQGKLDYDKSFWAGGAAGVDGTIYLEPVPVTETYTPCIVTAQDYTNPDSAPKPDQSGGYIGQLHVNYVTVPEVGTEIDVDAGSLLACNMSIDETPQNEARFFTSHEMNVGYDRTFRFEANTLLVNYAKKSACQTDITNMSAASNVVATYVRGVLAGDAVTRELVAGPAPAPINVHFADPAISHAQAETDFTNSLTDISKITESFPDSKNRTHKMKPAVFSPNAFQQVTCNAVSIQLQPLPQRG